MMNRIENKTPFHEQWIKIDGSIFNYDLRQKSVGLGSISFDLITGGWEWKHFDLSLLDFGHAELALEYVKGEGVKVSALASIYSPSITFKIFGIKIEISLEIGAIGGEFNFTNKKAKMKGAYGLGLGLSIEW